MTILRDGQAKAAAANHRFERLIARFLKRWAQSHEAATLLRFENPLKAYLAGDALRDFFLSTPHPLHELLKDRAIGSHLGRAFHRVFFDPVTGDPLLSASEQRIYNLARRLDNESAQVPFRSVHPLKQTPCGDTADVASYPPDSEVRYNSGNHFSSRPANGHVFDEYSKQCLAYACDGLHILYKRGFLEDRLAEVRSMTCAAQEAGQTGYLLFVICSRHSPKEGHYAVTLLVMDTAAPLFPKRVLVCDTLLKDLPHHPRWWNFFMEEYANVFGMGIKDMIEDISHPLQKVNIKGDDPYRHDWDCPYYAAAMTFALARLAAKHPQLIVSGKATAIHQAMKKQMPAYYLPHGVLKDRDGIRQANRLKRWNSGRLLLRKIAAEAQQQNAVLPI